MRKLYINLVLFISALLLSSVANAGKFYFTLGYDLDGGGFDSAELSLSSGGNYASTVDLGGTYFFNNKGTQMISFDVFSSLDSVQESGFLFSAGVRVVGFAADFEKAEEDGPNEQQSGFGIMPGLDTGYRFGTRVPTILLWSLDYAPNLLTTHMIDEIIQTGIFYEIMFTPIVIGSISYRYGTASFRDLDVKVPDRIKKFENSVSLGIKIRF